MAKRKRITLSLTIVLLVVVLSFLGWFLTGIFEGEKPRIEVKPLPEFLSGSQKFALTISDTKRGLRQLKVSLNQEGRQVTILDKTFPFKGLFNREGSHRFDTDLIVDPATLNLAQGRADLQVSVWDYSRRSGGDGNQALLQHKMLVDTIPPAIRALSKMHYITVGGTGLIVYQASSDSVKSGVLVNDLFFRGFPVKKDSPEGFHVCYFAIPYDLKGRPDLRLWAEDRAGNRSKGRFYFRILSKKFRTERINLTDRFLSHILPYFSFYHFAAGETDIEKFLKINRDLRQQNYQTFQDLGSKTGPERLWDGAWLRLKNAASMAGFAERRTYYYKGKQVDVQVHLGVDLASLANSKVQAANNGRVIFAEPLGIYGLTVVLDHGQGLASTYSHLSAISVSAGQEVSKGDEIGLTGMTGLAGGDHLHFGVMVGAAFVNPIEWWDPHWIQDNVTRKLALLNK
jgi:hypothetical protein